MGTGTFALPTLQALSLTDHLIMGLVTQPDRVGRGHHRHRNLLKEFAESKSIDVFQPENVNESLSLDRLWSYDADVFIVAAYGQLLSEKTLQIPPLGAFNLHGSLLPKYRGAAPIQYAVLSGETETGVTIFRIEPKLDAGPIISKESVSIGLRDTSGDVMNKLAEVSAHMTLELLNQLEHHTVRLVPQPKEGVTRAPKIKKEQGQIDWSKTGPQIDCHIRAMQPWPMPFTFLHRGESGTDSPLRMLILSVRPVQLPVEGVEMPGISVGTRLEPGQVVAANAGRLIVGCGKDAVEVLELQPAGKRAMPTETFLRGHSLTPVDRFGPEA